ncbi:MAG: hypothetical protein V2I43_05245 [Parvularcula sp.]|jgi:uncharacterized PurR-regulated membrane protein YhhQ (DUF165 family)|nr:hypothetical protein [Parvularcula sp.]
MSLERPVSAARPLEIEADDPVVVERFYDRELTGAQRVAKAIRAAFGSVVRLFALAILLLPLQLVALVTLDLPLAFFDRIGPAGLASASWLSRGEGLLILSILLICLLARRWGARLIGSAVLLSWALCLSGLFLLFVELAPQLQDAEFPTLRFASALIGSWVIGQLVAAGIYNLTRGGMWWRAPFYGALFGFFSQALIYFPGAFAGTEMPWRWWLIQHLFLTTAIAGLFLLVYAPLRGLIRPRRGLGGR